MNKPGASTVIFQNDKPDSLIEGLIQSQPLQAKVELSGSIVPLSSSKSNTSKGKPSDQFSMKTPIERTDRLISWHNSGKYSIVQP